MAISEYNKARVTVAFDEALKDERKRARLLQIVINHFLQENEEELKIIVGTTCYCGNDEHVEDLITELLILFIGNNKAEESPLLAKTYSDLLEKMVRGLGEDDHDPKTGSKESGVPDNK